MIPVSPLAVVAGLALAGSFIAHGSKAAESRPAQPVLASLVTPVAVPVLAAEPTRAAGPSRCTEQAWPYVARECLAAADGTPARKVVRVIGAR